MMEYYHFNEYCLTLQVIKTAEANAADTPRVYDKLSFHIKWADNPIKYKNEYTIADSDARYSFHKRRACIV